MVAFERSPRIEIDGGTESIKERSVTIELVCTTTKRFLLGSST